jgi:hypothetical protein
LLHKEWNGKKITQSLPACLVELLVIKLTARIGFSFPYQFTKYQAGSLVSFWVNKQFIAGQSGLN